MFLDEKGEKISKSKGNGLSLEEWLTYGNEESLAFYAYREPKKAKSLHIGVIPRAVDEYWQFRGNYPASRSSRSSATRSTTSMAARCRRAPAADLRPAAQPRSAARRGRQGHRVEVRPALCARHLAGDAPELDKLIGLAVNYARDFVAPTLQAPRARPNEIDALKDLDAELAGSWPPDTPGDEIQNVVFEVGKRHPFESLRHWFQALYETLLGSSQGPRMGSFIALYGIDNSPPRGGRNAAQTHDT